MALRMVRVSPQMVRRGFWEQDSRRGRLVPPPLPLGERSPVDDRSGCDGAALFDAFFEATLVALPKVVACEMPLAADGCRSCPGQRVTLHCASGRVTPSQPRPGQPTQGQQYLHTCAILPSPTACAVGWADQSTCAQITRYFAQCNTMQCRMLLPLSAAAALVVMPLDRLGENVLAAVGAPSEGLRGLAAERRGATCGDASGPSR